MKLTNITHLGDLDFAADMRNGGETIRVEFHMSQCAVSDEWYPVLEKLTGEDGRQIGLWWDWQEALGMGAKGTELDHDNFNPDDYEVAA